MQSRSLLRDYILNNYMFTDDQSSLNDNQSFLDTGIIDSIGVMEIVLFVEQEFGVQIEDADITPENLDSIENILTFITMKGSR